MEKRVHESLYSFLEKNSLLFEQQYSPVGIISKIQDVCDNDNFGVFIDFKRSLILSTMISHSIS